MYQQLLSVITKALFYSFVVKILSYYPEVKIHMNLLAV